MSYYVRRAAHRAAQRQGFTLVELLVVVVLLAIFAAVVVVNLQGADKEAGVPAARQAIRACPDFCVRGIVGR